MNWRRQGGAVKLVLIIVLVVVILLAGGIGAALYLSGILAQDGETVAAEPEEEAAAQPQEPAQYLELDPAITVNISAGQRRAVLQARVQVMARDEGVIAAVEQHMPLVRNNLILLFSDQEFDTLSTRDGKEALRVQSLEEVNAVLEQEGVADGIEALYFTSFVMQ